MGRFFTVDEVEYITEHYANKSTADIARHLNKKVAAIYNKAHTMGLKKSAEFQFKKGTTPWNKGKHFSAGGNSLKTRFKKGMLPHNTMKDGDITLRTDTKTKRQYYYIRIKKARWKELHVTRDLDLVIIAWVKSKPTFYQQLSIRQWWQHYKEQRYYSILNTQYS